MMPRRVQEEGLRVVNYCQRGEVEIVRLDCSSEEAPAKHVPAAAVIRVDQALFGITGLKGCVGGFKSGVKSLSPTEELAFDTAKLESTEVSGTMV